MNVEYIELPKISDERGSLSFMESNEAIPFDIKKVHYIYELKKNGIKRGEHAHFETNQVLFCLQGKVDIGLDDGKEKKLITLSQPNVGVALPPMIWHWMEGFEENTILLVVASHPHKESDNIRNYDEFLQHKRG